MTKLIINADDFGYCESVNYGIIKAHKCGVVSSTTIMANMPGFDHAIKLLKENPTLTCGVHMTLTCNKPLLKNTKTLTNEKGYFYRRLTDEIIEKMDLDEVYNEFCLQIEKVKKYIEISHLDSHHHVHTIPKFRKIIEKIARKYNLPIRQNLGLEGVKQIEFIGTFYEDNVSEEWFEKNSKLLKEKEIVDIMTHPAYLDYYVYNSTSYNINRMKELDVLTNEKTKNILEKNELILTNYKNL